MDKRRLKKIRKEHDLPEVAEVEVAAANLFGDDPKTWNVSDNHKAIVDVSDGRIFGIHSKGYRLARHEEGLLQLERQM